eukprot:CAMPEP_0171957490 /NCGR_PEP_ID=MMETSP0993-20121228/131737_1 /TAXON_ID=483369 /ORGANISM="non described non described, Strain CCMP2098" /LENGTH=108 /DNA_ID=CAMNT_0012604395 /DNA_START=83 /DNA_END=407 /DNA_ORIENTATION=-
MSSTASTVVENLAALILASGVHTGATNWARAERDLRMAIVWGRGYESIAVPADSSFASSSGPVGSPWPPWAVDNMSFTAVLGKHATSSTGAGHIVVLCCWYSGRSKKK